MSDINPNTALARAFGSFGLYNDKRTDMTAADLASGGLLSPTQLKPFLSNLYLATPIFDLVTKEVMTANKHEISRLGFAGRILKKPPAENAEVASNKRTAATPSKTVLTANQFRGEVDISNRWIRQNIMKEDAVGFILREVAMRCGVDVAITCMQGDTAINVVDDETEALSVLDGWMKKAKANGHVLDASNANIDTDLLSALRLTLPAKYVQSMKRKLQYLAEYNLAENYARQIERRIGLVGDAQLTQDMLTNYRGSKMVDSSEIATYTNSGATCGDILFTDPSNLVVGIHESITIKAVDWPATSSQRIFVEMEIDADFMRPDAVATAKNVALLS